MFDSCRACRRRLAQRSEGALPRSQWARLEAHLNRCPSCRRVDEADRALHLALSRSYHSYSMMTRDSADAFDDRVMNLLLNQPRSFWSVLLDEMRDRWARIRRAFRDSIISQVAGGAVMAAGVAASCLMYAIHPAAFHALPDKHFSQQSLTSNIRFVNGPAVPLEALLNTPLPSEALIWSRPPSDTSRAAANINTNASHNRVQQPGKTQPLPRGSF